MARVAEIGTAVGGGLTLIGVVLAFVLASMLARPGGAPVPIPAGGRT